MEERGFTDADVEDNLSNDPHGVWQPHHETFKHGDGRGNFCTTNSRGEVCTVFFYLRGGFKIE